MPLWGLLLGSDPLLGDPLRTILGHAATVLYINTCIKYTYFSIHVFKNQNRIESCTIIRFAPL
jgi:hypothetical protein